MLKKLKELDKKTIIMSIILLALIIVAAVVVIVVNLNKTKEVAQTEAENVEVVDVTDETIKFEYDNAPTAEPVALNIKEYDQTYNLYYYVQEIGQALSSETNGEDSQTAAEADAIETDAPEAEQVPQESEEVAEEVQNVEEVGTDKYTLYNGEPLNIEVNSIVCFKYEHNGEFSPNPYKLEITNIIDEGEITEGATAEELEEGKVDKGDKSNNVEAYYIKINYKANTVTIYKKDSNGDYTIPVKAMVCSTGKATPTSGVYKTSNKYVWKLLNGGVYGQYATRIVGSILFHSVPYASPNHNALKYAAYDKLGTKASAGCIRLTVADAKWIYDNCGLGTMVEFYASSNPGPLGKPSAQKISSVVECRNYDPTDPVANNPWRNYKGSTTTTTTPQAPTTPTPTPKPQEPTTTPEPTEPTEPTTPSETPGKDPEDGKDEEDGDTDVTEKPGDEVKEEV